MIGNRLIVAWICLLALACATQLAQQGETDADPKARGLGPSKPVPLARAQPAVVHFATARDLRAHVPAVREDAGISGERSLAAVALTQAWIAEAGWHSYREHAIQAHILARWAARMRVPLDEAIELRVWRFSRPPRWVRNVGPDCVRPNGWPWRLSWDAHAPLCRELYANAEAFLRGEVEDPCPAARGWRRRGPALDEALARGRRVVRCRGLNVYVR